MADTWLTSLSNILEPGLQVAAVAVNSGLVSYPTGYTPAYRTAGLTLWAPTPPEGYVGLGFLARPGDEPPLLTEVRSYTAAAPAALGTMSC